MDINELMALRKSNEAPFNHEEYTVWLHNRIVEKINNEIWEFREKKSDSTQSSYAACSQIMAIPSLKRIR